MRLHVHRSGDRLLEALKSSNGAYYATFARSTLDPEVLRETEAIAHERGHRDLIGAPDLRATAEASLREFFEYAACGDPERRFSYSSRVLLAVPDYPDVALVFLLRALRTSDARASVHVLIQDSWLADVVRFEAEGGPRPVFRAGWRRSVARGTRSLGRRALSSRSPRQCDVLIFTLGDSVARGAPDAYFSELASALAELCPVLTVYLSPGARMSFPQQPAALPLETFLSLPDVLRAWQQSRNGAAGATLGSGSADEVLVDYLRAREHESGEVFMQALMAEAFDDMLAALKPKTVVYPFENRSWEKRLLKAARRHGARCIGYQHSSITPRHLAFRSVAGLSGTDDLPDEIVTCGEITAEMIQTEIPEARPLVAVGTALRARRLGLAPPDAWGVLAPISSSRAEAWEILRFLHALSDEGDTPIVVRTHPTIPIDDLYAQFHWPAHVRLSRGQSLSDDFAATSLVAYSSSTVALEGMLYGRLPIYLDIGDIPSGNPIHGAHAFAFRASSGAELYQTIARIRAFTAAELASLRAQARAYAERYLIEPTPANVQRMARAIARC